MAATNTTFDNIDLANGNLPDGLVFVSGDRVTFKTGADITGVDNGANTTFQGTVMVKWAGQDGNFVLGNGDDTISFNPNRTGDIDIVGRKGDDTFATSEGNDTLNGGDGDDTLDGRDGDDKLIGGNGKDELIGGNGNDTLNGGNGDDMLKGGNNNDTLIGGRGNDTLDGGGGQDTFVVTSQAGKTDVITNFNFVNEEIKVNGDNAVASITHSDIGAGGTRIVFENGYKLDLNGVDENEFNFANGAGRIDIAGSTDPVDPVDPDPEPNTDLDGVNGDFFSLLYG